ncbi:MAG: 16S rRNA (guanine(527)-N(7))-methyltransferase RsmG [Defluviitaleaceae bacterium]|nr:16S rRNA (guanine(527)-N(7))-methyltransferase RsmG [Defluviitaleaceae bacterium]
MSDYELLKNALRQLGHAPAPEQLDRFMAYSRLLLEWNAKTNLTAITEPKDILLKHFADSISVADFITSGQAISLLDVGTGAGFPGVPIKIMRSDIRLTLLDSLNKRITFLRALAAELALSDVEFIHVRAEDAARTQLRESFDVVVSRAVAALPALAEYCLPFVKQGGRFIAMKGPEPENEIAAAGSLIHELGGGAVSLKHITIPFTDIRHSLIIIEKQHPTPERYPRGVKKIGRQHRYASGAL